MSAKCLELLKKLVVVGRKSPQQNHCLYITFVENNDYWYIVQRDWWKVAVSG